MTSVTRTLASTFAEHPKKMGRRELDGVQDGIPWQVRALGYMGVPAAIACYLVWVLAQGIAPAIQTLGTTTTNTANAEQNTLNSIVLSLGAMQVEHNQLRTVNEDILNVLKVTCANQAKDPSARERCLR